MWKVWRVLELASDRQAEPRTWEPNEVEFPLPIIRATNELNYSKNNWKTSKKHSPENALFDERNSSTAAHSFVRSFVRIFGILLAFFLFCVLLPHLMPIFWQWWCVPVRMPTLFFDRQTFLAHSKQIMFTNKQGGNGCRQQTNGIFQ